jgi:hypothetical protein
MRALTGVFAIEPRRNICRNAGRMSRRLNWITPAIFVRTKAERNGDRNTSESVEAKSERLFVAAGAGRWN